MAYSLEAQAPGFVPARTEFLLTGTQQWLHIGVVVWQGHTAKNVDISGTVSQCESNEHLWIRFVGFYAADLIESHVSSAGQYHISGVNPGKYVAMLFDEDKLVVAKQLEMLTEGQRINFSCR